MDEDLEGTFPADLGEMEEEVQTSNNHDPFATFLGEDILKLDSIVIPVALLPTIYLQTYFFTDIVQQFTSPLDSSDEDAFAKINSHETMKSASCALENLTNALKFNDSYLFTFIQSGFLKALYNRNGENRLVGLPRIRQQRVRQMDCSLPSSVPQWMKRCFPNFYPSYESREPIIPNPNITIDLSVDAWHWRSEGESRSEGVAGTIAYYTGSGYYMDLAPTQNETHAMLAELFNGDWTTELLFETPYTGGLISSAEIRPLYLLRTNSPMECAIFIFQIISLFFVAYYLFREVYSIFKFFSYSETMGQLTATMNYALYDMVGFIVMFGIIFAAFVQAGTIMFSSTSSEFKSFDLTALTLYRIILGDFDMQAIYDAHIVLGPLYFIVYVFFVFFVLLNMFLAIIGEAYAKVKENMAKGKNDLKFILYLKYVRILA
ncbi:unnamed protein product [Rodentolepis nana]|uniref:PKD_channel domain-containing protein n=1 Tax=Rodentolepis nana TaxID=102285 RepID=A0A0R3T5K9_RODNA|nr:unnamed protein product [Rodentolepis nana]